MGYLTEKLPTLSSCLIFINLLNNYSPPIFTHLQGIRQVVFLPTFTQSAAPIQTLHCLHLGADTYTYQLPDLVGFLCSKE